MLAVSDFETLAQNAGYLMVAFGILIEGEVTMTLGGFAARRGYLDPILIAIVGAAAAIAHDQIAFWLGRRTGRAQLAKRPKLKLRAERLEPLLHRSRYLLAFGFRFIPGTRLVTPLLLGISGVRPALFTACNAAACILWAATYTTIGFVFGAAAERWLHEAERYEGPLLIIGASAAAIIWAYRTYRRHRRRRLTTRLIDPTN